MGTALVPTSRSDRNNAAMRAAIALKAAVGIFRPESAREAYGLLMRIFPGGNGTPPKRGSKEFAQAYSENAWLRAITERVAFATASVSWRLYVKKSKRTNRAIRDADWQTAGVKERLAIRKDLQRKGEMTEVEEHPMLDFLRNGNSMLSGRNVRALTIAYHDLLGEAYWVKSRNALGMPTTPWPIPPHWILATPTVQQPVYRIGYGEWQVDIPDADVIGFYNPDPANPYGRGSGLAQAVADELDTDEYAAKYAATFFFNRARPDLIISGEGLTPDVAKELESKWLAKLQGVGRWFRPFFMNKTVSVQEIGQTFEQMELIELRKHQRDTIMQIWGMPPEIMGVLSNSNRATITSAEYLFQQHIVVPRAEALRDTLQSQAVPEFDERLVLDYVSPVPEDREHQRAMVTATPWAFTVDEIRAIADLPPKEDGSGEVHMVPFSLLPTGAIDEAPGTGPEPDTES